MGKNEMRRLALDIDGVFADFTTSYIRLVKQVTNVDRFPSNHANPDEYPTVWDYDKALGYTKEQISDVWGVILNDENWWFNLKPLPGAKAALINIDHLIKRGHHVYFMTTRFGLKCKLQTEKWLYQLGVSYPTVLVGDDKLGAICSLRCDFFIDDKPTTIADVANNTSGVKVYMQDAPYNRDPAFQSKHVTVVKSVKEALEKEGLWLDTK